MSIKNSLKIGLCFFLAPLLIGANEVELQSIEVQGNIEDIKEKNVGETKISAEKLSKEQASDIKDLVKYETGVSVVESGRFGTSGYAIRGVDENRVAITIDGLHQSETLSSQGFKEIFEGYGNFNNTRNSIEIENIKQALISKGADSVKVGSGALGGSVMFQTKDARDFLINKDWYIGFKNGYQSKNQESLVALTAAFRYKWFDFLYIKSKRKGHETQNYFYDIYSSDEEDRLALGRERQKADPYTITKNSNLVKIGFQPSEDHRFSFSLDDYNTRSNGEDLSYVFRDSQYVDVEVFGERKNDDKSKRRAFIYTYENFTETPFWDTFKVSFAKQKIKNNARTDEFCDGPNCKNVTNPQKLKYVDKNGVLTLVDKNDNELVVKTEPNPYSGREQFSHFENSQGQRLESLVDYNNHRRAPASSVFINCDAMDCTKKIKVFKEGNLDSTPVNGFVEREIEIKEKDGKKYGQVKLKKEPNFFGDLDDENLYFVLPGRSGYETNFYNDRDLITNTNQLNLDFTKDFELLGTSHELKYGFSYAKTKKAMINKDGYKASNVQWWADGFYGTDRTIQNGHYVYEPNFNKFPGGSFPRNSDGKFSSYLIPVKTKTGAFYIGDKIEVTDWLGFDINYRKDKITYKPYYDRSTPVPNGLVAGIFIPLPGSPLPGGSCSYNSNCFRQNFEQNLNILLQDRTFKNSSYSFGLNLDPTPWARVQFKVSKAFRAPTPDEIYMTFKHPNFSIRPNIYLKEEKARTKELALTLHNEASYVRFSGFKSDYDDFIDFAYYGHRPVVGSAIPYPFYGSVNRDKAHVKGFEVASNLELGQVSSYLDGINIGYKITHQKGKISTEDGNFVPMNAIQPTTQVFSIGYNKPKYGIDLYITHASAKKAKSTYNQYYKELMEPVNQIQVVNNGATPVYRLINGKRVTDSTLAWRSNAYTVLDAIAHYRPTENFTISFGLYNITNTKYMTWDSARSIRTFGTTNLINQATGMGIGRFYAPKRNFKLNWELKF